MHSSCSCSKGGRLRRPDAGGYHRLEGHGHERLPAALLSIPRCATSSTDQTRNFFSPGIQSALALSSVRRPHGGHPDTYGCPDPTPLSTLSHRGRRMIRKFPSPLLGASDHLPPWCALLATKPAPHFQPHLKLSTQPHAAHRQTNPLCPLVNFSPTSRSFHHPKTIQFA